MKKKREDYLPVCQKVKRTMKITTLFLLIGILHVSATTYAQNQRISISVENGTFYDVVSQIEKQSEFMFFYNSDDIDNERDLSIRVKNKLVTDILDELVKDNELAYTISGKHIVISKAESIKQQTKRTVTGTVFDEYGEPIIGANIVEKGTMNGIITNIDGEFSLAVSDNAVLQVSYIGYVPLEIPVKNQTNIHITLKEDFQALDEVVVVGFGTQKKVNLTGAVATVSAKELDSRPITSVSAALQGLVPGMTIIQNSGQPGNDGGSIRIRGVGTLDKDAANPMILVDGVENSMDNIDYNDIETISVLKDASSAAIYGSKAANGVILITTKRGSEKKASISYNGNFGWQSRTNTADRLNSWEYAELYNEGLILDDKSPRFTEEDILAFKSGSDPYKYPNTKWDDLLYTESGFQQQHNVSITGGTEKARYLASVGYQQQNGLLKHTSKKQYNARTNLDMNPIDNLEVSLSLYFSNRDVVEPTNPYVGGIDKILGMTMISPWIPYKDANGDYGTVSDGNPIAWIEQGATTDKTQRRFNAIGSVKYTFMEGLSLKAIGSYRSDNDDSHEFRKDIWYNPTKYHGPNKLYEKTWLTTMLTGDIIANFNRSFGSHNIGAMAGFHAEKYDHKYGEMYRQNFPNNDLGDMNAGSTNGQTAQGYTRQLNMLSYFGRVNYDYMGKYLLEANVRSDASSRFADGYRWGTFPSFSAGWRLSEEAFMESIKDVLSNLKIRGSWGKLGNQSALGYYPSIPAIGLGKDYSYPFNGTINSGAAMNKANKRTISWEKTRTWGLGLDLGLWHNLNITIDYYDRLTTGILMDVKAPKTYGLDGYMDNVGEVSNKGIEVSASYSKRFGKVDVGISANYTYNKNEILNLGDEDYILEDDRKIKKVGSPINSFYGYKTNGLFKSEEEIANWAKYEMSNYKVLPGDLKYVDLNNDGVITANDRTVLGSTDPKHTFGFTLSAAYRGFDTQAFFQGAAGVSGYLIFGGVGEFVGDTGSPLTFWKDRWTPDNPNSKIPRIQNNHGISSPQIITSDYWEQNANYLRLKNLQIGYTFPTKWIQKCNMSKLRVFYSGQNLLTFTSFLKGWDPEAPVGSGSYYPQVKINSFGLNVTF